MSQKAEADIGSALVAGLFMACLCLIVKLTGHADITWWTVLYAGVLPLIVDLFWAAVYRLALGIALVVHHTLAIAERGRTVRL